MLIYLFVYLFIYLFIYLSIYLFSRDLMEVSEDVITTDHPTEAAIAVSTHSVGCNLWKVPGP